LQPSPRLSGFQFTFVKRVNQPEFVALYFSGETSDVLFEKSETIYSEKSISGTVNQFRALVVDLIVETCPQMMTATLRALSDR
jgi:hypothetical protein